MRFRLIGLFAFILSLAVLMGLSPSQALAKKDGKDTPHGWSQGEKKGWDGESLPPGLAKKSEGEEEETEEAAD